MITKNNRDAIISYAKKTRELFAQHRYTEAYQHDMEFPHHYDIPHSRMSLSEFADAMYDMRDEQGARLFPSRFVTHKNNRTDDLAISAVPGFEGRDHETLSALVNGSSTHDLGEPFVVSHDGYSFKCVMEGDDDFEEGQSIKVELMVTPFQWIEAAQKLGYEFVRLSDRQWRFNKINHESVKGIADYACLADAARAVCVYEGTVKHNDVVSQPDRLAILNDNSLPGATLVVGQSGIIYRREGEWRGIDDYKAIDMDAFQAFWGRFPEDGDEIWMAPYTDIHNKHHDVYSAVVREYLMKGGDIVPGIRLDQYRDILVEKISDRVEIIEPDILDVYPDLDALVQQCFANKTKVNDAVNLITNNTEVQDFDMGY